MNEIHGIAGAPYQTPQVRKKIPAPHSRERIDLDGGTSVKREWQDVNIFAVAVGDVVAGFGRVSREPQETVNIASGDDPFESRWTVRLTNVLGEVRDYPGHERVFAFARERLKKP